MAFAAEKDVTMRNHLLELRELTPPPTNITARYHPLDLRVHTLCVKVVTPFLRRCLTCRCPHSFSLPASSRQTPERTATRLVTENAYILNHNLKIYNDKSFTMKNTKSNRWRWLVCWFYYP